MKNTKKSIEQIKRKQITNEKMNKIIKSAIITKTKL